MPPACILVIGLALGILRLDSSVSDRQKPNGIKAAAKSRILSLRLRNFLFGFRSMFRQIRGIKAAAKSQILSLRLIWLRSTT